MVIDLTLDSSSDDSSFFHTPRAKKTSPIDPAITSEHEKLLQAFQNGIKNRPIPVKAEVSQNGFESRVASPRNRKRRREEETSKSSRASSVYSLAQEQPPSSPQPRAEPKKPNLVTPIVSDYISPKKEAHAPASHATPESLPGHHGLNSFYGINPGNQAGRAKKKDVKRTDIHLRRGSLFRPQRLRNKRTWKQLYTESLSAIEGPEVRLCLSNKAPRLDFNFEFVNYYKLQEGVERVDSNFHAGCDCTDCSPRTCSCLSQEEDSDDRIMPYKGGRDGVVVLRRDFMKRNAMIYECSSLCSCGQYCWNRVVEAGRTVEMEIFDTKSRGLGLRSSDPIQAGQFIDSYLGEVVTKATADDREEAMGATDAASYLFSLDFFFADMDDEENGYVVDGRKYGSITRFMNHSCNPNCKMFSVSHNHSDNRIFELAFFALTDIPPYTELTFDYYPNWKRDGPSKVDPDAVKCLCGEPNCRGQLWPNKRKTTTQYESD